MRRATQAVMATPILAVLAALALSGCGNSSSGSTLATQPARVSLTSSAIRGAKLPALYTCDGKDVSPPLSWGAVPSDIEEVAIFALGARRAPNGQTLGSIEWALAGVRPGLHTLRAGEVPHGAFLLAGSTGKRRYSICPHKGETEHFTFALYALPHGARASPKISSVALFNNLTESGIARDETPAAGGFAVNYTRR
jgi:phosphatidylethanolamine-binding protein (PEBP) family uncharacterized protein